MAENPQNQSDRQPARTARRFAAIDIGTVTCRLLVADVDDGCLTELARGYRITNLGEGVDATGVLKESAIARVESAMRAFIEQRDGFIDEQHPTITTVAMATSASRDANNGDEFRERMAALGIDLAIIPGEREAALSFKGASSDYPGAPLFVADVGGGSTEVIAGIGAEDPLFAHSFNVGCRRMTEKFFTQDPPTADSIERAADWVRSEMSGYFAEIERSGFKPERLVAVAGTATSAISMREEMAVYDSSRVHGAELMRADLHDLRCRLAAMPLAEREQVVGLDPGRAPVIVAGLVIQEVLLELSGMGAFTASEHDILQGIILSASRG